MNGTGDGGGESNKPTISRVTLTICVLGVMFGATICVLAVMERAVPSELNMTAGIVIGGLLSMLTKSTPTPSTPAVLAPAEPTGTVIVPEQKLETTTTNP